MENCESNESEGKELIVRWKYSHYSKKLTEVLIVEEKDCKSINPVEKGLFHKKDIIILSCLVQSPGENKIGTLYMLLYKLVSQFLNNSHFPKI